jgi:hypothetical protein
LFLKLTERKEQQPPALAEVRDRLAAALRTHRASELERAYVAQLGVTIDEAALADLQRSLPTGR